MIGRALRARLEAAGVRVVGCDLRASNLCERFDLRDLPAVRRAMRECGGVIHLGGVSRIIEGERNSELCKSVNISGTSGIVDAAAESPKRPWMLFASSREVYGQPPNLPCVEGTPPNPINVYAKSKLAAERMVLSLRERGGTVAVLRFSNVFGSTDDYPDRVVPAFAKAAASGGILRLEGPDSVFDFTALEDSVSAAHKTVEALQTGRSDMPPLDIVTGRATSLRELADISLSAGSGETIIAPPRLFSASRFQGDPRAAARHLGWRAAIPLEQRVTRLVGDFRTLMGASADADMTEANI